VPRPWRWADEAQLTQSAGVSGPAAKVEQGLQPDGRARPAGDAHPPPARQPGRRGAAAPPCGAQAGGAGGVRLLDVGSGGGLPGVVFAICCPDVDVSCVDTVGKKAAFIQQAAVALKLRNLHGVHARVETLTTPFDVISCRAFASLPDFVTWSRSALAMPHGVWLAMKGKHPAGRNRRAACRCAGVSRGTAHRAGAGCRALHCLDEARLTDLFEGRQGAGRVNSGSGRSAAQTFQPSRESHMFGIADYGAFVAAIVLFLAIPGPGNLALITSTSKGGVRGGLAATLGVIAGRPGADVGGGGRCGGLAGHVPHGFPCRAVAGRCLSGLAGLQDADGQARAAQPMLEHPAAPLFQAGRTHHLLNPKAIVFYMAFFPLFVDPARHQGMLTFGVMAATIAALTLLYGLTWCCLRTTWPSACAPTPALPACWKKLAGVFSSALASSWPSPNNHP
jgi:16S rRNA (guanine(527)-N(7))-methyltransferase RsmG